MILHSKDCLKGVQPFAECTCFTPKPSSPVQARHSPTPWKLIPDSGEHGQHIVDADGRVIVFDLSEADSAHIVNCVNTPPVQPADGEWKYRLADSFGFVRETNRYFHNVLSEDDLCRHVGFGATPKEATANAQTIIDALNRESEIPKIIAATIRAERSKHPNATADEFLNHLLNCHD